MLNQQQSATTTAYAWLNHQLAPTLTRPLPMMTSVCVAPQSVQVTRVCSAYPPPTLVVQFLRAQLQMARLKMLMLACVEKEAARK